jgi:hypothetical protein
MSWPLEQDSNHLALGCQEHRASLAKLRSEFGATLATASIIANSAAGHPIPDIRQRSEHEERGASANKFNSMRVQERAASHVVQREDNDERAKTQGGPELRGHGHVKSLPA